MTVRKMPQSAIAVIGMAGRFPGARTVGEFWRNLRAGVESLEPYSDEALAALGVPAALLANPSYVKAGSALERAADFDAAFFGVNPREAEVMDPQHRIFLETAWEALEDAGYDVDRIGVPVGVFAGASMNTYLISNLLANPDALAATGAYQAMIGNDKDFLATRVSYKLNLRGPSFTVQTACSTSLVAVHLACESLLTHQCDMALAGGVSIAFPQRTGYLHQEGMILSPDGKVRPFDAKGGGIRAGEGAGLVVLKRLEDALADGDNIRAVILGTAINNDGAQKIGYTAPSVDGQAEAIATAQSIGEVDPATITYIEAHGTSTPLGDPIEIAALTQVFRAHTDSKQYCAIGSVKSNIGHLDAAAGVAGLIKTVLSLEHREIAPSLNFETPNPQIDFAASPFFVNTQLRPWEPAGGVRRAGVSSFGIGGTNAHAVLEEAPPVVATDASGSEQILVLSARTPTALDAARTRLAEYFAANPHANLADVAYTLQTGRRVFDHRCMLLADSVASAKKVLETPASRELERAHGEAGARTIAFMFSGQGSQYPGMGWALYQKEPVFRAALDSCAQLLQKDLGLDLRAAIYPELAAAYGWAPISAEQLNETRLTQPALFAVEYSLAKLWEHWGIVPQAMIGHSIGEYVAACLAGVFSLESTLSIVAARGALMQKMEPGAMLAVQLDEAGIGAYLGGQLSVAALNAPGMCVVSGPIAAIDALERKLETQGISARRLRTSHAFHSSMMDGAVAPFVAEVARHSLSAPRIPFVSNVTGTWITAEQATDPQYWGRHLRGAVRFADGVQTLARDGDRLLVEVGPGNTLKTLARQTLGVPDDAVVASLPHPLERVPADSCARRALGRVWLAGIQVNWSALHGARKPRRVSLPTYPFESKRFWVEPLPRAALAAAASAMGVGPAARRSDIGDWFWLPSWQRSSALAARAAAGKRAARGRWLVFGDESRACVTLLQELDNLGVEVVDVQRGDAFAPMGPNRYAIRPDAREDYDRLLAAALPKNAPLAGVLHLWNTGAADGAPDPALGRRDGFYSTLYLAQALGDVALAAPLPVLVVSTDMQPVLGAEALRIERSLLIGPVLVMSQDVPNLRARSIDIASADWNARQAPLLAAALVGEAALSSSPNQVAYRSGYRWEQAMAPVRIESPAAEEVPLRQRGVYLITGGLGGLGLAIARHLARTLEARLILTARSALPDRARWSELLEDAETSAAVKARIRAVQELEQLGAEVLVAAADVADEAAMSEVVATARRRFGTLHGVLHAAGLPGIGILPLKTAEAAEIVLRPKVEGTLVLDRVLAGADLDFLVLFSTINTAFGWHGTTDYSSANAFLDAFAQAGVARCSSRVITVNWGTWREVGMAADLAAQRGDSEGALMQLAIAPEEGSEALRRALASGLTNVFITPRPMPELIAEVANATRSIQANDAGDAAQAVEAAPAQPLSARHERPELDNPYVAPRDPEEEKLAAMWSELLGIQPIGVEDNFFDLGGHSLLATRVLARVQDIFKVRLPMRAIFEAPTVAGLAEHVRTALWAAEAKSRAVREPEENREEIEL
jgi:acyl transferase domain-containing protein/acyl carrier protein